MKRPNQALQHNDRDCHGNGTKIVHDPRHAIEANQMAECLKNCLNLVPLIRHARC